jgi:hypothetical protein
MLVGAASDNQEHPMTGSYAIMPRTKVAGS